MYKYLQKEKRIGKRN